MGGYASTLFHLLYRFSPEIRSEFGRSEESKWVQRYGFLEQSVRHDRDLDDPTEDGSVSRRKSYRNQTKERPGLAPGALFHIIGHSLFLKLSDVASGLPPYEEQIQVARLDDEPNLHGFSQASAYQQLAHQLKRALLVALERGSQRLLSTYLQSLLAYPGGLHPRRDGLRPRLGRGDRAVAALGRAARLPEGAAADRPRRAGAASPGAGCWSTRLTPAPATSPAGSRPCWRGTASAPR